MQMRPTREETYRIIQKALHFIANIVYVTYEPTNQHQRTQLSGCWTISFNFFVTDAVFLISGCCSNYNAVYQTKNSKMPFYVVVKYSLKISSISQVTTLQYQQKRIYGHFMHDYTRKKERYV